MESGIRLSGKLPDVSDYIERRPLPQWNAARAERDWPEGQEANRESLLAGGGQEGVSDVCPFAADFRGVGLGQARDRVGNDQLQSIAGK